MVWQPEDKDDDFSVSTQWQMAKMILKPLKDSGVSPVQVSSKYTNPIVPGTIHKIVDAGAKQFTSHEDVMAKLLGVKC